MPARSARQRRFVLAAADRGEEWAKRWVREYGHGLGVKKVKRRRVQRG